MRNSCLEVLSDLKLKQSKQTADQKYQAREYLTQAQELVKGYFPKESPHLIRIATKLKKLEKQ